jgi:hypothetical protein
LTFQVLNDTFSPANGRELKLIERSMPVMSEAVPYQAGPERRMPGKNKR